MNKPVKPPSTADATLLSAGMQAEVHAYIADPEAAERKTAERVRRRHRGEHPQLAIAEIRIEEEEARLADLRGDRDEHVQAKRGGDLMREKLVGLRDGKLTVFDFAMFIGIAVVGIGGNFVALSNIATYVADSGVIERLTDNFYAALFVSAIPFSGSAVVKAIGAFQPDSKTERAFNLRIAKYACAFVVAHIIAITIFFAPHKLDVAALQQAIADGVEPTSPMVAAMHYAASYLLLGTGLLAEMLIAPVVVSYAHKLHRAGRPIVTTLHDEQTVHRRIIDEINMKIDAAITRLGKALAEVDKHESAQAEMIDATQHLYRETAADLKAEERRARDDFFSKRSKGASR